MYSLGPNDEPRCSNVLKRSTCIYSLSVSYDLFRIYLVVYLVAGSSRSVKLAAAAAESFLLGGENKCLSYKLLLYKILIEFITLGEL